MAEFDFPLKETLLGEVWDVSLNCVLQVVHDELCAAACPYEQQQCGRVYLAQALKILPSN